MNGVTGEPVTRDRVLIIGRYFVGDDVVWAFSELRAHGLRPLVVGDGIELVPALDTARADLEAFVASIGGVSTPTIH